MEQINLNTCDKPITRILKKQAISPGGGYQQVRAVAHWDYIINCPNRASIGRFVEWISKSESKINRGEL